MITTNLNVADGLANVLKSFRVGKIAGSNEQIPLVLFIEFAREVGDQARKAFDYRSGEDRTLTPIVPQSYTITSQKHMSIVREQFPVVPAEAITITNRKVRPFQLWL
jgi:hypothetical protein